MNKYITIIFFMIIFLFSCKQSNKNDNQKIVRDKKIQTNRETQIQVSYKSLFNTIKQSDVMDIDVFFAITVCIKINAKKHDKEIESLTTEEKITFFENETKKFFDSIKFSQEDYNKFMLEHAEEIPLYLDKHPELRPYLNTFN